MLSILIAAAATILGIGIYFIARRDEPLIARGALGGGVVIAAVVLILSSLAQVRASYVGVVTVFGSIQPQTLPEGLHFVGPLAKVHEVYTGVQFATVDSTEASSKDLQVVHASMQVNFHPVQSRVRDLFALNTWLDYDKSIVPPAAIEVFKATTAQYTAEELITKRQEVSDQIMRHLSEKLGPYFLTVQSIQLTQFGFSKSFDASIEEKVTASQKAATAQRNLERVKFEAESRIAQAKGEAEAIRIQADAVSKAGGEDYVRLKAVEKWNGQLPQYVTGTTPAPFIGVK